MRIAALLALLVCCTALAAPAPKSHAVDDISPAAAKKYVAALQNCLKNTASDCFRDYVPERFYFTEQADYHCATADKKAHAYITPSEFLTCLKHSTPRDDCTGAGNLADDLKRCLNKAPRIDGSDMYFEPDAGPRCYFKQLAGHLEFEDVACGC